jgi:hypothetical protein
MTTFVPDQNPVKNRSLPAGRQGPERGKSNSKASRSLRDPRKTKTRFIQQSMKTNVDLLEKKP